MQCGRYSCQIKKKSLQIFEKPPNMKIHENPSSGTWRTDRPDKAKSRSSQFLERAWKPAWTLRYIRRSHKVDCEDLSVWYQSFRAASCTTYKTTHRNLSTRRYPHTALHDDAPKSLDQTVPTYRTTRRRIPPWPAPIFIAQRLKTNATRAAERIAFLEDSNRVGYDALL